MAVSRVQAKKSGAAGASSVSATFDSNVSTDSVVVVVAARYSSVSDTLAVGDLSTSGTATVGTWQIHVQRERLDAGAYYWTVIASAPVTAGGSLTVTVGGGASSYYWSESIAEYSTVDTGSSRCPSTNSADYSGSSTPSSGNATTGQAGLLVGIVVSNTSGTLTFTESGAGWATVNELESGATYMAFSHTERIVSADTTDDAAWTLGSSSTGNCCVAALKEAAPAETPADYGTPYDHDGVKPWSSIWRPGRI